VFAAVLDTCVLWPNLQRDFLLSLAVEGLYRPLWSDQILEELVFAETEKWRRRGLGEPEATGRATRLETRMREAFPDAIVVRFEPLIGTFRLPDPDDEHVLAAAVLAGAGAVVTDNIRDFPAPCLPRGLGIIDPRAFAVQTVEVDPSRAWVAVQAISQRSGRVGSVMSSKDVLTELEIRYRMHSAVALIRSVAG